MVFVERERDRERDRQGVSDQNQMVVDVRGWGVRLKLLFIDCMSDRFMVCIIIFNSLSPFPPSFINFVTFFPIFLLPYLPVVGLKTLLSKIVCFPAFQNPQELTSNQASSDVFAVSV